MTTQNLLVELQVEELPPKALKNWVMLLRNLYGRAWLICSC